MANEHICRLMSGYPIGAVLRLRGDNIGDTHEISGYEIHADAVYILFLDGTVLNAARTDLIEEILEAEDAA